MPWYFSSCGQGPVSEGDYNNFPYHYTIQLHWEACWTSIWKMRNFVQRISTIFGGTSEYVLGTIAVMETLPAYMHGGTCVSGTRIFHQIFWEFQPCIKGFALCKPINKVDGTW